MIELVTSAQMRATEQAAIDSGEVTELELMECAGRGVVEAIFEEWPKMAQTCHRAVILCGPGNNGGDGFVVARLLEEWGWEVELFLYGNAEKLPPDARVNYERWINIGSVQALTKGVIEKQTDIAVEKEGTDIYGNPSFERGQSTIFVDALFGTGLCRRFDGDLLEISREWSDYCYENGIAVDIPSGLCADSGYPIGGNWFFCRIVVSFGSLKVGQYLGECLYDIDKIHCVDLNLPSHEATQLNLLETWDIDVDARGLVGGGLQKTLHQHKYSHGHAYVLSGPSTKTGAARLAARGALRIGAGLVTIGATLSAMNEHAAHLNAIMLAEVSDADDYTDNIASDERINAVCIGPALGLERDQAELLKAVLQSQRTTTIDADALTLISKDKALFDLLHEKCVLTPHGGEFARLFPDISEKLSAKPTKGPVYSKVDATRLAAKRAGCVVLFKGPDTVIAAPDGSCSINSAHYKRSAPWLATAGSGDVLAGFVTGLLARGFAPMQAAETAAWLHVECALQFGPGLIAEDIPEQLPLVFRKLGL